MTKVNLRWYILLAVFATALILSGGAYAGILTPESGGSPNADRIHTLYTVVLVMSFVVMFGVFAVLAYVIYRFRESKNPTASQVRHNSKLEITWTAGASVIIVIIAIFTLTQLGSIRNPEESGPDGLASVAGTPALNLPSEQIFGKGSAEEPPGGNALHIKVVGMQYAWRFQYPNGSYAYDTMVVPSDTTVLLDIESIDVIHSWWVPKLGGKFDAVPGYTNHTWFKAAKTGTYKGQCAELCGQGHANMFNSVKVINPTEYATWVQDLKKNLTESDRQLELQRKQIEASAKS